MAIDIENYVNNEASTNAGETSSAETEAGNTETDATNSADDANNADAASSTNAATNPEDDATEATNTQDGIESTNNQSNANESSSDAAIEETVPKHEAVRGDLGVFLTLSLAGDVNVTTRQELVDRMAPITLVLQRRTASYDAEADQWQAWSAWKDVSGDAGTHELTADELASYLSAEQNQDFLPLGIAEDETVRTNDLAQQSNKEDDVAAYTFKDLALQDVTDEGAYASRSEYRVVVNSVGSSAALVVDEDKTTETAEVYTGSKDPSDTEHADFEATIATAPVLILDANEAAQLDRNDVALTATLTSTAQDSATDSTADEAVNKNDELTTEEPSSTSSNEADATSGSAAQDEQTLPVSTTPLGTQLMAMNALVQAQGTNSLMLVASSEETVAPFEVTLDARNFLAGHKVVFTTNTDVKVTVDGVTTPHTANTPFAIDPSVKSFTVDASTDPGDPVVTTETVSVPADSEKPTKQTTTTTKTYTYKDAHGNTVTKTHVEEQVIEYAYDVAKPDVEPFAQTSDTTWGTNEQGQTTQTTVTIITYKVTNAEDNSTTTTTQTTTAITTYDETGASVSTDTTTVCNAVTTHPVTTSDTTETTATTDENAVALTVMTGDSTSGDTSMVYSGVAALGATTVKLTAASATFTVQEPQDSVSLTKEWRDNELAVASKPTFTWTVQYAYADINASEGETYAWQDFTPNTIIGHDGTSDVTFATLSGSSAPNDALAANPTKKTASEYTYLFDEVAHAEGETYNPALYQYVYDNGSWRPVVYRVYEKGPLPTSSNASDPKYYQTWEEDENGVDSILVNTLLQSSSAMSDWSATVEWHDGGNKYTTRD
ncbi:MAG: hypothetical protein Q4C03_05295, partial [bacterium]|nr:hypothetical protein [bacterium]